MKTNRFLLFFASAAFLVSSAAYAGDGYAPRRERPLNDTNLSVADSDSAELDSFIVAYMDEHHIPGLAAAVVKNGDIIWTGDYGNAYFTPDIPVSDSTLFMLASVSKTVTGTALMQLYEEGYFDLNDPVNDYLPFPVVHPQYPNTDITFFMLLTHTSGIRDNWFVMNYYHGDSPIPLGEYLEGYLVPGGAWYHPILNFAPWEPGTQYEYCNNAVALIGYLVEVIAGTPFDQYCQNNVFAPLDMTETAWFLAQLDTMDVAEPFHWDGDEYVGYGHFGYSDYPSGQLRTSAEQLARFLSSYLKYGACGTERILDSTTVALMTSPQIPGIDPSQGLIWYTFNLGGRQLWGHGGGDFGVTTEMYLCREQNSGVVILTNGESYFFDILDALFDYAEMYEVSLSVDLTPHNPPIQIPAPGGNFSFDIAVRNEDSTQVTFDLWIEVLLPNGSQTEPIMQRAGLTLQPGDSLVRTDLVQYVPGSAPPGEYAYIAKAGYQPAVVTAADTIFFTKDAGRSASGTADGWSFAGWGKAGSVETTENPTPVVVYPNPFNPQTTITFTLPRADEVSLAVYDMNGRKVAQLVKGWYPAGAYRATFNGDIFASGVYLARFESGGITQTRKLLLMK